LEQEKGFVEVEIEKSTVHSPQSAETSSATINVKFHQVSAREMSELPFVEAQDLDQEQVLQEIEKRTEAADIAEKIVRLKVKNIPEHIYSSLDFRKVAELKSKAFHFDLRFERKEEEAKDQSTKTSIGKLNVEFEQFLKQVPVENLKKDRLLELGLKYLSVESGIQ